MVPSKDPYREKELSTSPLGSMEPEIIKEELFPKASPKLRSLGRDIYKILLVLGFGIVFLSLFQMWAMWAAVTN